MATELEIMTHAKHYIDQMADVYCLIKFNNIFQN